MPRFILSFWLRASMQHNCAVCCFLLGVCMFVSWWWGGIGVMLSYIFMCVYILVLYIHTYSLCSVSFWGHVLWISPFIPLNKFHIMYLTIAIRSKIYSTLAMRTGSDFCAFPSNEWADVPGVGGLEASACILADFQLSQDLFCIPFEIFGYAL